MPVGDIEMGRGKLYVWWEPDEVEGGKTPPGFRAEVPGYLEIRQESDLIEGPNNGMWREFFGAIVREVRFSVLPPTGPMVIELTGRDLPPIRQVMDQALRHMMRLAHTDPEG